MNSKQQPIKRTRCAVYTRKSTEEGLEQEFNSLDAQREAGEAYVASQRHEGWTLVSDYYDDGGFSGGSMGCPVFKINNHRLKTFVFFLLTFEYEKIFYQNPYMMEKVYEAGKRYKA